MKLRIKQNNVGEVVCDLDYRGITDILDIIPNEKIKEISITIEEQEADNGKKD